jgi:serine protease SohB
VLNFNGDIRASAVEMLRREITTVLTQADPAHDEVVLCLESPGGLVHGYGLAASQLARIRQQGVPLTICVDKVAASGGYMMACIGNRIIAAPFAVVGSIGVVAQLPNVHRLLKKHDIDVELMTAGEYKRTLTVFGPNSDAGRAKFQEELDDTHALFKEFVAGHRPQVEIDRVATGEHWYGQRALELKLVDELKTSDEYLVERAKAAELFAVRYVPRHRLLTRLGLSAEAAADRLALRWWDRLQQRPKL